VPQLSKDDDYLQKSLCFFGVKSTFISSFDVARDTCVEYFSSKIK
jgi:hypothetical protein